MIVVITSLLQDCMGDRSDHFLLHDCMCDHLSVTGLHGWSW